MLSEPIFFEVATVIMHDKKLFIKCNHIKLTTTATKETTHPNRSDYSVE